MNSSIKWINWKIKLYRFENQRGTVVSSGWSWWEVSKEKKIDWSLIRTKKLIALKQYMTTINKNQFHLIYHQKIILDCNFLALTSPIFPTNIKPCGNLLCICVTSLLECKNVYNLNDARFRTDFHFETPYKDSVLGLQITQMHAAQFSVNKLHN